jgi:hypothetical protein
MHTEVFPTWNKTGGIKVLIACTIPLPLSRSVTLQRENDDSEAESILCAVVCELDYRLDVYHVTKGAHIQHLQDMCYKLVELLFHFYKFL